MRLVILAGLALGCSQSPEEVSGQLVTNEVPPPLSLSLTASGPQVAGQPIDYIVTNAQAGQAVQLGVSLSMAPGATCPAPLSPVCLDLDGNIILLGAATADAAGVATFSVNIPATAPLTTVHLQAGSVGPTGVDTSNVYSAPILASSGGTCTLDFDGIYSTTGDGGDPTTGYSSTGIVFTQTSGFGLVGGDANGDPGNWSDDPAGTVPDVAWGCWDFGSEENTISFPVSTSDVSFDLLRTAGSASVELTADAYLAGALVDTVTVTLTDGVLERTQVSFGSQSVDEVVTYISGAAHFAYAIDNLSYTNPFPCP